MDKHIIQMQYKQYKEYARQMRLNPTSAERKLWQSLRKKQLEQLRKDLKETDTDYPKIQKVIDENWDK